MVEKKFSDWCELGRHETCSKKFIYMEIEYGCLCSCHDDGNAYVLANPKNPYDKIAIEV